MRLTVNNFKKFALYTSNVEFCVAVWYNFGVDKSKGGVLWPQSNRILNR